VSCGRSNAAEQKKAADHSEVVDNLRAVLDMERSTTQQLTDRLQHEQERVAQLTMELSQLSDQLTVSRTVAAQLRTNMDSMVVRHLVKIMLDSIFVIIL